MVIFFTLPHKIAKKNFRQISITVNYYKELKVSPDATQTEIKSAYRRLARKKHPDVNGGDKKSSLEFARIAKAYRVLSDPQERAYYDKQRLRAKFSAGDTFFDMQNPYSDRAKKIIYEKHYNYIIDRMIAEDRQESMALQQIIFPIVSLFISTGFVTVFKPMFWSTSSMLGKIIMLTLFIVGVLHLLKRLHFGLEKYTYSSINVHDSLFVEAEEESKPYSRLTAISFLIFGVLMSLLIGLIINSFLGVVSSAFLPALFSDTFRLEFFFYPPIIVLLVDVLHIFASRVEVEKNPLF